MEGHVADPPRPDLHSGLAADRGAPGGDRPPHHPRAGQDARRGSGRGAARHAVHGLDRPPGRLDHRHHGADRVRPDDGAHVARAARRRRADHAVELPVQHPELEARLVAHLREHGRPEAGAADAAHRDRARPGAPRCRAPGGRRQPRPRLRPGGGGDDGDRPAREGDLVHRLDGGRDRHQRQGGRARQEGAGRDGRPQRGRSCSRTRTSSGRRRAA